MKSPSNKTAYSRRGLCAVLGLMTLRPWSSKQESRECHVRQTQPRRLTHKMSSAPTAPPLRCSSPDDPAAALQCLPVTRCRLQPIFCPRAQRVSRKSMSPVGQSRCRDPMTGPDLVGGAALASTNHRFGVCVGEGRGAGLRLLAT